MKGITYWAEKAKSVWFNDKLKQIQTDIDRKFTNSVNIIFDADSSLNFFLFKSCSDIKPSEYFYYNAAKNEITPLFKRRSWIEPEKMAPKKPITFYTRDTLKLYGYLSVPQNSNPPYPTIIKLHGGPWARDYWGFDNSIQIFVNRGYAVLQVNYRGSKGYGYEISQKYKFSYHIMHKDVIDATKYLISSGVADSVSVELPVT